MSYKITINRVESKTELKDGEYVVIDKRPWTDKEIAEASDYYRNDEKFLKDNPLKEIKGYAPRREVIVKEDVKIFEQIVDSMDVAAVIKAVNQIK